MATIVLGRVLSSATDSVRADQGTPGAQPWPVLRANTLVPVAYDALAITYDGQGNITTVVYKNGVTTVATLTLSYNVQGLLSNVTRS